MRSMPASSVGRIVETMQRHCLAMFLLCFFLALVGGSSLGQDEPSIDPDQNQGAQIFSSQCAYCHGADGRGGRAPAIATLPKVIGLSNQDLMGIVHKGEADQGMPAFPDLGDEGTKAVVQYLRTLQGVTVDGSTARLPGDPGRGQEVFDGKGQCSTCHMILGKGGFMAAELTSYARNRSADEIMQAIVSPDADLQPASRVVHVRPRQETVLPAWCARKITSTSPCKRRTDSITFYRGAA